MKRKNSKGRIIEFNPVIYPTRIWVSHKPEFKVIEKEFDFLDYEDEVVDEPLSEWKEHSKAIATTFSVVCKYNGWMGCLVVVFRKAEADVGIIAHEAGHCCDWLCDHFGIEGFSYKDGEARQYYTQWVANCINKVLRNKA